jgi:hypothetical protein
MPASIYVEVVRPEADFRCTHTTWSSPTLSLEIPEDLQQKLSVGSRIAKHVVDLLNFLPASQGRKTWSTITVTSIKSKLFGETELRN